MARYTTASRVWVAALVALALTVTFLSGAPTGISSNAWLVFAILGLCGATVHLFPIKSALGGATYTLTNVFLITGAVTLPAPLLTPLALLALTPERWRRRGRPGMLLGWGFNVAQSALALHIAGAWVRLAGSPRVTDWLELGVLLLGAALFTLTQDVLVGVIISLQSGTPIFSSDTFRLPALLSDSLMAVLGVIVAGLWLSAPHLLALLPPLLFIVFRLTRTAHLAHLAEVDVKTGLHNYRHFERALDDEIARSRRAGRPLAVLFADLDHFKRVNDRHGHGVGDRVLLQTSNLISSALRKTDLVARFGGEEFVALLPGTDPEEAIYLAERVRRAVETHHFAYGEENLFLRCTISVGVATFPADATDAFSLMKEADNAVYQAKLSRNAVGRPAGSAPRGAQGAAAQSPTGVSEASAATLEREREPGLTPAPALLVWTCVAAALLLVGRSVADVHLVGDAWAALLPLVLLSVAAEFLGVRISEGGRERITFSFASAASMVAVTAMPIIAPLIALAGSLVRALRGPRRSAHRVAFNLANPSVSAGVAAQVYLWLRPEDAGFSLAHLTAGLAAVAIYHVCTVGASSLLVSLSLRRSLGQVIRESAGEPWSASTTVLLGLTGAFVGVGHAQLGLVGTAMFAVPVLIMRFSLAVYGNRSERAIETLLALNRQLETEIGQHKRVEATLEHQALHDPLTDLPNRSCFQARLQEALQAEPVALLLLDLDRFKEINDTFGHQWADAVLQLVAQRLRESLRASGTIARLGGDAFGVLLSGADAAAAQRAARDLLDALRRPVIVEDQPLEIDACIGIALSPEHGTDPDVLLRRADAAMYQARRGHTGLAVYSAELDQHSPERLQLVAELRRAIEHDELVLHFQPQAAVGSRRVVGLQALVRWIHPVRGPIPPDQFIPLAENTGLIRPLSRWALNAALRQLRAWQADGLQVSVSINLSMRDLQDRRLPELVADLLREWDIPPQRLGLEITESAVMADVERAIDVLAGLRATGVRVAIDAFGTGSSSLSDLKRLPVDELKIDRSFVRHMAEDATDMAIVRSTIGLAHDLGLSVVADGVEDQPTWELLARLGCDAAQGSHLHRAMPAAEVPAWLAARELQRAA